jgi:aspergillopepsin I
MISFLTILALAVVAQGAPTTERATSSFSLPAVHNTASTRNGTAAMLKAYRKFGLTPTQQFSQSFMEQLHRSKKRQDSTVTATPDSNDVEYVVPVTIGGENLNLDVDTGSADL